MAKSVSLKTDFKKSLEKGRRSDIKRLFPNSKALPERVLSAIRLNCLMVAFILVYGILRGSPHGIILGISSVLISVSVLLEIAWFVKRNPC